MKRIILMALLCGVAAGAWSAEVYRWVDERGVTVYGEKPPANRPARPIDTRPAASSLDAEGKVVEPVKPAPQATAPQMVIAPPPPPPPVAQEKLVRGMDFSVFIYLQRGMTEGEVRLRAGPPDDESVENFRNFVVKSLYYYPTSANPFITVVTLRGGRVADIERTRKTF
jgi:hypothetical protein